MASSLTVPRLRSPPMCRQNASSTCRRPAESAKTTSFVPNACTACGPGSRNELVSPRQCQPRANLAGGTPVSMVRTPSPSLMQGLHASLTCLQQVIECCCHLLYCPRSDTLTDTLEHVLVLWRWPAVNERNQEGHPVTENDGQAVVDRVSELLPMLRDRAQQAEDARVVPRGVHQGAGGGRPLPAAAAGQVRRLRGGSADLLHGCPADRERLRVHRVGVLRGRPASLARGPVPAPGPGRGLGRGPGDQDLFLLRPHREGRGGARRAQAVRALELFLGLRPLHLGAARQLRVLRRQAGGLPYLPAADPRLPDR